jgi:hypothetical protein
MMVFLEKNGRLPLCQNQIGVEELPDFTVGKYPREIHYVLVIKPTLIEFMDNKDSSRCGIENESRIMKNGNSSKEGLIGWVQDVQSFEFCLVRGENSTGSDISEYKQARPSESPRKIGYSYDHRLGLSTFTIKRGVFLGSFVKLTAAKRKPVCQHAASSYLPDYAHQ